MRVIREYERFWKRAFEYACSHDLEPYSFLWYIVLTPSVRSNDSKRFKRFFDKFASLADIDNAVPRYVVYLNYVMRIMHLWCNERFWPTKNAEGLEMLYELIMNDYKSGKQCTFEEALAEEGDWTKDEILKRSWYIIDSVLKDANHEQVRLIICRSIDEENKYITEETKGAHVLFNVYDTDESFRSVVDEMVREDLAGEISDIELAKYFVCKVRGDVVEIQLKYLKLLYAGLCALRDIQQLEEKYNKRISELYESIKELQRFYHSEIRMIVDENEHLKQLAQREKKTDKIYVSSDDKIEILKSEYEAQIAELEEKLRMYKEQLDDLTKQVAKDEYIPAFESPQYVAYFGLKNQLFEEKLAQYNVFIKLFSPYTPPSFVPNLPIVFNIDVASHSVWDHIKSKKPLLVSGSNARLIAERVVKWLREREA